MDNKKRIEELQDKLNKMIDEGVDFKRILKVSRELDLCIVEFMNKEINE